jgi:ABC-type polysaccharide/polyol phosphate export permease
MLALVKREMKARYARTYLGIFWSVLKPLAYLAVYGLFFALIEGKEKLQTPYLLVILLA